MRVLCDEDSVFRVYAIVMMIVRSNWIKPLALLFGILERVVFVSNEQWLETEVTAELQVGSDRPSRQRVANINDCFSPMTPVASAGSAFHPCRWTQLKGTTLSRVCQ